MSKIIINWELSLFCNLDCSFCSQWMRRKKQKNQLTFDQISKIIAHLPANAHISFLWWETLLHSQIHHIFWLLEARHITYEITTNGSLLHKIPIGNEMYTGLKHITLSLDGYGTYHDTSRWKIGLFEGIQKQMMRILPTYSITISTVLTESISDENFIKLLLYVESMGFPVLKLIYCMSFGDTEIRESKEKIPTLDIEYPWSGEGESLVYKTFFLKKLFLARKILKQTRLQVEPVWLFLHSEHPRCKQIHSQYRINEYGRLSICEFITNSYHSLIDYSFDEVIAHEEYTSLKDAIGKHFPLSICKNCCKLEYS